MIALPTVPHANPTKASHIGMSPKDLTVCKEEIQHLLDQGLIEVSDSPWACVAFYVNKHAE